ncbi:MAG: hypothetical protein ACYSUU_07950 [Planctomycetota bacterium]|jgi:hypothetical protein
MFWKLILIVLTLGGTACGLLVLRQQERDVFATQTVLRREISRLEHELQAKALRIAELSRLEVLRTYRDEAAASRGVSWRPLPFAPDFRRSAIRPEASDGQTAPEATNRPDLPPRDLASADESTGAHSREPSVPHGVETDRTGS